MKPLGEGLVGFSQTVMNLFGTNRYQETVRLLKLEQTSWRECPFSDHDDRRRHPLSHGHRLCRNLNIVTRKGRAFACNRDDPRYSWHAERSNICARSPIVTYSSTN